MTLDISVTLQIKKKKDLEKFGYRSITSSSPSSRMHMQADLVPKIIYHTFWVFHLLYHKIKTYLKFKVLCPYSWGIYGLVYPFFLLGELENGLGNKCMAHSVGLRVLGVLKELNGNVKYYCCFHFAHETCSLPHLISNRLDHDFLILPSTNLRIVD